MKGIAATVGANSQRSFFWLDQSFAMMTSSPAGLGFNLNLGGIFTSVPAAATAIARRPLEITQAANAPLTAASGTGDTARSAPAAVAVAGLAAAPVISTPASGAQAAAGSRAAETASIVGVGGLLPLVQRFDLFGLGLDYALYHKRFWGPVAQNDPSAWQGLGGVFTSAPAAIAWAGDRVDVFGVGTDHAMYQRTATGEAWSPQWQSIGGTFTSAASLVLSGPQQLNLFARGADFTMRGNHTDGTTWFGFENHGGNLASAPAAVSWGADRIDVFALFNDGTLQHRWWDGAIWNDWESLGGNYLGEPAAVSWAAGRLDVFVLGADQQLHHHWFSNDTWAVPEILNIGSAAGMSESPTALSPAANELWVFVPTNDNQIRLGTWNGQNWEFGSTGATLRMPSRYAFSVDYVTVQNTRALNSDTDGAVASVAAGNAAVQTKTQWIGDIGGATNPKQTQTNLLNFSPVTIDLAEPMSFSYQIVNNGHADQDQILAALASGSNSLSLGGASSMEEDIGKGVAKIISVTLEGAIKVSVPVVGSILGAIEGWLLGQLTAIVFQICDGVVAVELRAMMGRDLFMMTDNGNKPVTVTTTHNGTDSPVTCGANSVYDVTWSIKPL